MKFISKGDGPRKETVFKAVTRSWELPEFPGMFHSCPGSYRFEVKVLFYIYKVVDYLVKHSKLQLCSPGLESFPLEMDKHVRH